MSSKPERQQGSQRHAPKRRIRHIVCKKEESDHGDYPSSHERHALRKGNKRPAPFPKTTASTKYQRDMSQLSLLSQRKNNACYPPYSAARSHINIGNLSRITRRVCTPFDPEKEWRKQYEAANTLYQEKMRELQCRDDLEQKRNVLLNLLRRLGPAPLWLGCGARTPYEQRLDEQRELQKLAANETTFIRWEGDQDRDPAQWPILVNTAARFELGIPSIDTAKLVANNPNFHGFYGCVKFKAANFYTVLPTYGKVVNVRIFPKGSVSITGAPTEEQALDAANRVAEYLNLINIPCRVLNFDVKNYVVRFDYGHYINIRSIKEEYPQTSINSQFQTLAFREVVGKPPVAMISGTGRGMVVGLANLHQASRFLQRIYSILSRHHCGEAEYKQQNEHKPLEIKSLADVIKVLLQMASETSTDEPKKQQVKAALEYIETLNHPSESQDSEAAAYTDLVRKDMMSYVRASLGADVNYMCNDEGITNSDLAVPEATACEDQVDEDEEDEVASGGGGGDSVSGGSDIDYSWTQ